MENLDHTAKGHVNSAAGNLVYSIDVRNAVINRPVASAFFTEMVATPNARGVNT
jgi:hypothetical protein